jgi:hypothetical protein
MYCSIIIDKIWIDGNTVTLFYLQDAVPEVKFLQHPCQVWKDHMYLCLDGRVHATLGFVLAANG